MFIYKEPGFPKQSLLHIQVASYGVGGHFYLHHDPMFIYKEPGFHATSVETRGSDSYITGTSLPLT
jgi:hypothetical protein